MYFLLIALFATGLFIYSYASKKYPPGPVALPFIGNMLTIKKFCKQHGGLPNACQELCKRYKTDVLSLNISGSFTVVVQSEPLINEVFGGNSYLGRPNHFFIRLRSMGEIRGLTMTDGELWRQQRAFAVKHLHEHGLGTRKMEYMIQRQCKAMLLNLPEGEISNLVLKKYITKCVLNVIWEIVTGSPFQDEKVMNDLTSLMEARAKAFDISGGFLSVFPWIRFLLPNYSGYNLIQDLNSKFKDMISEVIQYHKTTYKQNQSRDFIDSYLQEMYQNPGSNIFTEEQLVMVCLDLFIGASQTTSSTLDFCFLYMTIHQDMQEKVQKELDNVLLPGQMPSIEDKDKCPYVEAVLLEVQRLCPVAPLVGPRRTTSDTTLNGYFIPKDTNVLINIESIHGNSKKWESPEKFMPERFLSQDGKLRQDQKLYNFGRGKRRCPAEALAKTSLFILFSSILHNFKLQAPNPENPPTVKKIAGITSSPSNYCTRLTCRFQSDKTDFLELNRN